VLGTKSHPPVVQSFFVLGGSSLKAASVMVQIKKHFGVEVSLADFYSSSSVRSLAAFIDGSTETTQDIKHLPPWPSEAASKVGEFKASFFKCKC